MFKAISTLTIFGLLAMSAAQAQSNQPLHAQIPFAFEVQGATLPAGAYQLSYSNTSHLLTLNTAKHAVFLTMRPAANSPVASETGKVLFQCYRGSCYLAAVWPSATSGQPALQVITPEPASRMSFVTRAVSLAATAK
jgi:hypothetical protein